MCFIFFKKFKSYYNLFLSIILTILILNIGMIINLNINTQLTTNAAEISAYDEVDSSDDDEDYYSSREDRLIDYCAPESEVELKIIDKFIGEDENGNKIYEYTENSKDSDPIKFRYFINEDEIMDYATLLSIDNGFNDDIIIPNFLGGCPVTEIAENACKGLDFGFIKISSNVEIIGKNAFADCTWLSKVELKDSSNLKFIEEGAFSGCIKLNTIYKDIEKAENAGVFIPQRVEKIGANAFANNKSLNFVYFDLCPNLKIIEDGAFSGCCNLESIHIPYSVNVIGENAFANNTSLERVCLDAYSQLNFIGNGAFSGCSILEEIYIPKDIIRIGDNAFSGCTNLRYINLPNGFILTGREGKPDSAETYEYWI